MKPRHITLGILLAAVMTLSGCGSGNSNDSTSPATETQAPPADETQTPSSAPVTHETHVITTQGETIAVQVTTEGFRFPGFSGKPAVLEFYGDTCPHCRDAIPIYNQLQNKYGDRVLILTVNDGAQYTTLDNAGLQSFANTYGIGYRTVSRENSGNLRTYAEALVGPMPGVPYVIVVNKEGVITARMLGPTAARLEASISDVLQ